MWPRLKPCNEIKKMQAAYHMHMGYITAASQDPSPTTYKQGFTCLYIEQALNTNKLTQNTQNKEWKREKAHGEQTQAVRLSLHMRCMSMLWDVSPQVAVTFTV